MRLLEARFRWTLLAIVSVSLGLLSNASVGAQEITFCYLPLPKEILQAHASFNAVYEFDVDQHGSPINIKPVAAQFTNPRDVQSCLASWSLPSSASTHLVAVFEWQHGIGWAKLAISGPDLKLIIHLSGLIR